MPETPPPLPPPFDHLRVGLALCYVIWAGFLLVFFAMLFGRDGPPSGMVMGFWRLSLLIVALHVAIRVGRREALRRLDADR